MRMHAGVLGVSAAFSLTCPSARAAFISEIDLGGPAGNAVELSDIDPGRDYSLLVIDANPYSVSNFGLVLGVVHLPAGSTPRSVAMLSESAWPGQPGRTTPLDSLSSPPTPGGFNMQYARLLVVMDGLTDAVYLDRPLAAAHDRSRYDASAVTDWVVFGSGDLSLRYQSNGHDIDAINTTLGIDLLERIADRDAGRVIGRANRPGQVMEMDRFFVGDPDARNQFNAGDGFFYNYTPGESNLTLSTIPIPEPATLGLFAFVLLGRRRQRT